MVHSPRHILIADDDPSVRAALSRVLTQGGYSVVVADDGRAALEVFKGGNIELIVSDIAMPLLDGVALLRTVRELDDEIPVILLTGVPSTNSASGAVRYRATEYLPKPVAPDQLLECVARALRFYRLAQARRAALALHQRELAEAEKTSELELSFERALASVFMVYQPIVSWSRRSVFGYEALVRSSEASLPHPGALFDAAEKLGQLQSLGRQIRERCGGPMAKAPADASLFVNLHTRDLLDDTLFASNSPLAAIAPRVIFEITERADLDEVGDVEQRISRLRELGFRIAIDDIGAGYSGLNSFALLRPDIVKLDITLVRHVDRDAMKQKLVRTLAGLCAELGISVIAEGVETAPERDMLIGLGCDLLQGYLLARPAAPFAEPKF
jgi:EAL domain-containing protein (putative c-di-GMP-specific phosphodiesterase class I)